ncbi:hypothetical protein AMATHDRAFT_53891 [Amanita thiersii Skay4041]|uniref:Uncharacterized protein n=1 Tax=Amanita thiersii Skay4041 TaxID=703135 RepID=A0A2A9P0W2_9AGAR|nr:hypothetical protein AMATHDRAFT_53891 [Amanita thiersii Skay4041]
MDRVCDEILQLIFYELNDPTPLTLASRRFFTFSQDPYVRAHYFLARYGPVEAFYFAFARGRLVTERVLDILVASGAHMSRYLVQIAMHHYFYTHSHFIKSTWVRKVPLRVFTYFLALAENCYGDIPRGKNDDDGTLFVNFLKESRFPTDLRSITWETIREILEKYKFMPLCNKDPIMSRLPLALAVEPRLLPYAVANGFYMDSKYRDFVFRKMFEKPLPSAIVDPNEIAHNVRELCKLDPSMFVTRTVAAEVCMEAKINESGYRALKLLDRSGHLRFELSTLVCDLIKTFRKTRSITNPNVLENLRYLYSDTPLSDPSARLVMITATFLSNTLNHASQTSPIQSLEVLGVTPITRSDICEVFMSPFVERHINVMPVARRMVVKADQSKGLSEEEVQELLFDVAVRCLEVGCKGKFLDKILHEYPAVMNVVESAILDRYWIKVEDLPSWDENPEAASSFTAKLSHDYMKYGIEDPFSKLSHDVLGTTSGKNHAHDNKQGSIMQGTSSVVAGGEHDLGSITQESLSTMIRQDEAAPSRSRRRIDYPWGTFSDSAGKLHYPPNCHDVACWIKKRCGSKSAAAAVCMIHAVINSNELVLSQYLCLDERFCNWKAAVPLTLNHFHMLARLGRAPASKLFMAIESGAEFYHDEHEYLSAEEQPLRVQTNVKASGYRTCSASTSTPRGRKRPRRSAVKAVRSYAVPDSEDEDTSYDPMAKDSLTRNNMGKDHGLTVSQISVNNMGTWVEQLSGLLRSEQKKHAAKKKQLEKDFGTDGCMQLPKTEFIKSMSIQLRHLRKIHNDLHNKVFPNIVDEEMCSDDDYDDEYQYRAPRSKRRKSTEV